MVTAKEAGAVSPIQFAEVLTVEQNSFVRFIDENKDLFDRYSSLTYELRDEEEGWRNSSTADQIINGYIDLVISISPHKPNDKQLRKVSRDIRKHTLGMLFSSPDEKGNFTEDLIRNKLFSMRKVNNQQVPATIALYDRMDEFNRDFHEEKAPVVAQLQESKAELFSNFKNYLLSDPNSIFAFKDFLLDRKYAPSRDAIRPFLASFAQSEDRLAKSGKGILGEAVREWVDDILKQATPDLLDELVASIKINSPNILKWLEFAARGEGVVSYLKGRSDVFIWPSDLSKAFKSFVASKYQLTLGDIRKELDRFRRKPEDFSGAIILGNELVKSKKRTTKSMQEQMAQEENDKAEVLKKKYTVGILSQGIGAAFEIRVLTEEELTRRLQKEADSFAPADQRMIADLDKIFLSLREEPYGFGTEKLKDRFIVIGHKELSLRSLNPGKRIGLSHDHPDSHDIRIVYVIYKNNEEPMIGLEGVYRHDDYMGRFKFDK